MTDLAEMIRLRMIINQTFKGGEGSGNFGHAGRPGEVGGSSSNRLSSSYIAPNKIKDIYGTAIVPPRSFYRGTNIGDTRRIRTGSDEWDSYLFVSDNEKYAKDYGKNISNVIAKPEAKILYEGTKLYKELARETKSASNFEVYKYVAKRAKEEGFDAVWFLRQGDTGTAILNPSAFEIGVAK